MMKSLVALLVVLVLVAVVAVAGSRAQPLPRANPLLRICEQTGPIAQESARCRPVVLLTTAGELEREYESDIVSDFGGDWGDAGGDYSDPEFLVKAAVDFARAFFVAIAADLAERFTDWAFGGNVSQSAASSYVEATIFDPWQ